MRKRKEKPMPALQIAADDAQVRSGILVPVKELLELLTEENLAKVIEDIKAAIGWENIASGSTDNGDAPSVKHLVVSDSPSAETLRVRIYKAIKSSFDTTIDRTRDSAHFSRIMILQALLPDPLFGLIDRQGQWVVEPRFQEVGFFSEGLASVQQNGTCGFIDKQGKWVIPPQFESMKYCPHFSECLAAMRRGSLWGYIDKQGKWAISIATITFPV